MASKLYKLAKLAEDDLLEIQLYGLSNWGVEASDKYHHELLRIVHTLCQQPNMGRNRPDLYQDAQIFPVGSHVIIFKKSQIPGLKIEIARIRPAKSDYESLF